MVWGCWGLLGNHARGLRSPDCWGCFVFCQVVPVLRARLGSCLRLGTVCYSGTSKVTAKAALSTGMGKKHGWELDKRNREHIGPEDKSRAWSDIRAREDKELTLDQVLEQSKVRSRNQGKTVRNIASSLARKSFSDCLLWCLGGDKPRAAGGYEGYWALRSTRIKGGQAGSHWRQGLSGANTSREK